MDALDGEMSLVELMSALGLTNRKHFRAQQYWTPAMDQGLIAMTLPNKPNSRLQRYRLTELGERLKRGEG